MNEIGIHLYEKNKTLQPLFADLKIGERFKLCAFPALGTLYKTSKTLCVNSNGLKIKPYLNTRVILKGEI